MNHLILIIIGIISAFSIIQIFIFLKYRNTQKEKINLTQLKQQIEDCEQNLINKRKENDDVLKEAKSLSETITNLQELINSYKEEIGKLSQQYDDEKINVSKAILELNNNYKQQEDNLQSLKKIKEEEIQAEIAKEYLELSKVRETRVAAIEAYLRESSIKNNLSFYCLELNSSDKHDIAILREVEERLTNSRPLRMVIWTAYYSKKVNELCARVFKKEKVGIYKITNIKSNYCYIGQSKNLTERIREHFKCGLGIDTPAGNKLYIAMQQEGLENFSVELLEACDAKDLDEKEKTYIALYESYQYGYNSNSGNGEKKYIK